MFFGRIVTVRGFLASSNLTRKTALMSLAEAEKGWERSIVAANSTQFFYCRHLDFFVLASPVALDFPQLDPFDPFDVLASHGECRKENWNR